MNIRVVTLFPEMFSCLYADGVVGNALRTGKVLLTCVNPRDFAVGPHRRVDDKPYGGGAGMVMKPEPLAAAIDSARRELPHAPVLFLSPGGICYNDHMARKLATAAELIFVAGRYQGIDERVIESRIDGCISVGNYVTSGGELPAMIVIDALMRHIPSVIGNRESLSEDSFANLDALAAPCYTRPAVFEGMKLPKELLSGDHALIKEWRTRKAQERTAQWQENQKLEFPEGDKSNI